MTGSYNQMIAFSSTLSHQTGETYAPQFLSIEQYQSIISSGTGNGGGRSNSAGNGNGKGAGKP